MLPNGWHVNSKVDPIRFQSIRLPAEKNPENPEPTAFEQGPHKDPRKDPWTGARDPAGIHIKRIKPRHQLNDPDEWQRVKWFLIGPFTAPAPLLKDFLCVCSLLLPFPILLPPDPSCTFADFFLIDCHLCGNQRLAGSEPTKEKQKKNENRWRNAHTRSQDGPKKKTKTKTKSRRIFNCTSTGSSTMWQKKGGKNKWNPDFFKRSCRIFCSRSISNRWKKSCRIVNGVRKATPRRDEEIDSIQN